MRVFMVFINPSDLHTDKPVVISFSNYDRDGKIIHDGIYNRSLSYLSRIAGWFGNMHVTPNTPWRFRPFLGGGFGIVAEKST